MADSFPPHGDWPQPPSHSIPSSPSPPEGPGQDPRKSNGTRNLLIALAAGLLLLAVAVPLLLSRLGDRMDAISSGSDEEVPGGELPEGLSPGDAPVPMPGAPFRPDSVAVGGGSVWVSDLACGVVVRIDPAARRVVGSLTVGGSASGVAFADDSVWVGNRSEKQVVRIDPVANRTQASVEVDGYPLGLAAGEGSIWAVDESEGSVHRIDPETNRVVATVKVGKNPHYVAVGPTGVWVTNVMGESVTRIDPETNKVAATVETGSEPLHVIEAAGSVWVTNAGDFTVSRIDPATNDVTATIPVEVYPHALAFAEGHVWVGTESGPMSEIDPATNVASRVPDADFVSIDMAVDGRNIWVADAVAGSVVLVDAATGKVVDEIVLADYGDCEKLREEAVPPTPQVV